jgi:hypothetical protein
MSEGGVLMVQWRAARRRPVTAVAGHRPVLPVIALAAFLGMVALVAGAVPVRAADLSRVEGETTIGGHYVGMIETTEYPPDSGYPPMLDTASDCGWTFELYIDATDGEVGIWINCTTRPLSHSQVVPLTWDGTTVSFRWDFPTVDGQSTGYQEWSGTVMPIDNMVTISGTFTGRNLVGVGSTFAGIWEVTRVADTDETTSTTQPAAVGGDVSTTTMSTSTTAPSQPATEGEESPSGDEGLAWMFQAGDEGTGEGGSWSPLGVAFLILFTIIGLLIAGFTVREAVAGILARAGNLPTWALAANREREAPGQSSPGQSPPGQSSPSVTIDVPMTGVAWERVLFSSRFDTGLPNGGIARYEPGEYRLGPPDANGYRQITDMAGRRLPGTIHASQVPPPLNQPTGGVLTAPPPPAPPPAPPPP